MVRWLRLLWLIALLSGAHATCAQTLESLLAPGKVVQAHAKWEDECKACHVRFERAAQDRLCMDCHKDIGADVRARTGLHGRGTTGACRECHTDHKGREARIVSFDTKRFDHVATDFPLRGAHRTTECTKCHAAGRKYSAAASDCQACHRGDDVHKGSLGPRCADCHTENRWREAKFDHATTRFALTGRHAEAKCAACHKDTHYRETPRQCVACHRKDDDGARGHKGQYGERCDSCHGDRAWKPSTFQHDVATKFALRGQHRAAKCGDCHTGPLYKSRLETECFACHRQDDKHKESLGRDCGACHSERSWKDKPRFDHEKTSFPLLGKHVQTRCDACHTSLVFKDAPTACVACHRKDDRHAATLGEDCASCHVERDWKTTAGRFDHDRARFRLRGAHASPRLACSACHTDLKGFRSTPGDCFACHRKDDKHAGQLGTQCASCHDDAAWRVAAFDHAKSRFPLVGRHVSTACKDCHPTARFRDAPRECLACHRKDDRHHGAFGTACQSCHNARAWSIWDFDHDRRTSFRLDAAHRRVACDACHVQPAPAGRAAAPLDAGCLACHRKDDVHDGAYGARCEQCHAGDTWKAALRRGMPRAATPAANAASGGRR